MCANKKIRVLCMKKLDKAREEIIEHLQTITPCHKIVYRHPDERAWERIREQVRIESHELGHE